MTQELADLPRRLAAHSASAPALFLPDAKAAERFFEFFTANIRNKNTRRAYYKAVCRFADWCEGRGVADLAQVKPVHVAAYIESLAAELAKPSVKQHLAAIRMLLDWLVIGHVLDVNPAHAVRGPKHVVKKGRTPVLTSDEARAMLAAIDTGSLTGLRDRALIGTMIYTFARIGAVLQMNVGDYFTKDAAAGSGCTRRAARNMKRPAITSWKPSLDAYLAAAGIAGDRDGALFRTTGRTTGTPQRMGQSDAYRMIQRRARQAGIETKIGNHSLRATGITDYLKNSGTLEHAQQMANHSSPRTTKLYDRRNR